MKIAMNVLRSLTLSFPLLVFFLATFSGCGGDPNPVIFELESSESFNLIIRNDPRFNDLVPLDARLEILATGFLWSEGPVWVTPGDAVAGVAGSRDADEKVPVDNSAAGTSSAELDRTYEFVAGGGGRSRGKGFLLFSDIPRNTVFKWEKDRGIAEFLKPSGYTSPHIRVGEVGSNGLLLDSDGNLVLCEHGDRRISRLNRDRSRTTLVDQYLGNRLNSPNDAVFKSNGDLYFTDPPYGLPKRNDDPSKELDFNGVFRLSRGGELTLLTRELTYPNGIGFSPDEKTLYVANSDPKRAIWMAYDVKADGTLGEGRFFFDATPWVGTRKGLPDGLTVDRKGNVFATGPGGVLVFAPDGTHLGTIGTGQPTANCAWGDDGSTLYITANQNLCRIKLSTAGNVGSAP